MYPRRQGYALDDGIRVGDLATVRDDVLLGVVDDRVWGVLVLEVNDGRLRKHAGDDGESGSEKTEGAHGVLCWMVDSSGRCCRCRGDETGRCYRKRDVTAIVVSMGIIGMLRSTGTRGLDLIYVLASNRRG